jgi:hypothetical protein
MHKRQDMQNKSRLGNIRLRSVSVLGLLLGLSQPFMALANTEEVTEQATEEKDNRFPAGVCLTDTDMGDATARGAHESLVYLQSILSGDSDGSNGEDNLENIAKLIIPISDLLDYDMVMTGVTYAEGEATTINPDGSIQLLLPSHIDKISYKNIRAKGSDSDYVGNVSVNDINLSGSSALIRDAD